jgi:hypothetical protein
VSATTAAVRGRILIESQMTSTCSIAPPGAEPVTDPDTGEVTFPPGVAVYTGKCRVRPMGTQSQTVEAGSAELFEFDYQVSVPFAAVGIREHMLLTIDSSPDPDAAGLVLEIQQVARGEHITARRLLCNEVA